MPYLRQQIVSVSEQRNKREQTNYHVYGFCIQTLEKGLKMGYLLLKLTNDSVIDSECPLLNQRWSLKDKLPFAYYSLTGYNSLIKTK
jgi:hypothetical protein